MTVQKINEIALQYRSGQHEPNHVSYAAFEANTLAQYRVLVTDGWEFTRALCAEPYTTSAQMFEDIDARRIQVFTGGQNFAAGHPLARKLSNGWTINEIFRAVHDVNGHGRARSPFETLDGELAAYYWHARQYSLEAQGALFGETIGQLCHYYAGFGFVDVQKCIVF